MKDHEARFEIEFHKEPNDIDEAVYHAVNFIQTKRRNTCETNCERRFKKYAKRASQEFDCQSGDEDTPDAEVENNHAYRVQGKTDKRLPGKMYRAGQQTEEAQVKTTEQVDSIKVLQETRDMIQALVSQLKGQGMNDACMRIQQGNRGFLGGRQSVQCYGCREIGHIIRDCPKKPSRPGDSNGNSKREEGLQQGQRQKSHLNLEQGFSGGHNETCSDYNGQCKNVDQTDNNVVKSIKLTKKLPDGVYVRGQYKDAQYCLLQIQELQRQLFQTECLNH